MRILLLSPADTDLLAACGSGADYRVANPARTEPEELPDLLAGVDLVVIRLLGGRRAWERGLDEVLVSGLPVVCLGGDSPPETRSWGAPSAPAGGAGPGRG